MTRARRRAAGALVVLAALAAGSPARAGTRQERKAGEVTLVLLGPAGERMVRGRELEFVSFERVFRDRAAPRSESASGRRLEVEDRRRACGCVRFSDWSKVKFGKLRQIEIRYPEGAAAALVRLTRRSGKMREVAAGGLDGAGTSFAPRFAAVVDGEYREFVLLLEPGGGSAWPEERLVRILFQRAGAAPPAGRRR